MEFLHCRFCKEVGASNSGSPEPDVAPSGEETVFGFVFGFDMRCMNWQKYIYAFHINKSKLAPVSCC